MTTRSDVGSRAVARQRVLLVEDEADVSQVLARALHRSGYDVSPCESLREARAALGRQQFDVAVVDLVLPDGDGLDLVAEMSPTTPTIALSGHRATEQDRLRGFEVGADDYVVKPFSLRELVARVSAVRRRAGRAAPEPARLHYGDLEIDCAGRKVSLGGVEVPLTRMELDLLAALARRPRRACSRHELLLWVWHAPPGSIDPATVTEHVHRVRTKLGEDPDEPRHIVTVRGIGYRFDP